MVNKPAIWQTRTAARVEDAVILNTKNNVASGYASVAEGQNTTASGLNSHAEGSHTTASND